MNRFSLDRRQKSFKVSFTRKFLRHLIHSNTDRLNADTQHNSELYCYIAWSISNCRLTFCKLSSNPESNKTETADENDQQYAECSLVLYVSK